MRACVRARTLRCCSRILSRVTQVLGTPAEENWPGVSALDFFSSATFPSWKAIPLRRVVPSLDAVGLDLLRRMLVYSPAARIHAADALAHDWFRDHT